MLNSLKAEKEKVNIGNVVVGGDKPIFIAGPCSIESKEHILKEAKKLNEIGVDILRGGTYKPRSSPKSFQGMGYEGVEYLNEAREKENIPVVTEILSEYSVKKIYPYIDAYQIGTRNMYNYALLRMLGQQDKPVILKRGFSATLDEWVGAAKYIQLGGNQNIILCERGIRSFDNNTRNLLDIAGAVLVKERTGFPVIVDPSHGTGKRELIAPMTKAALAAGLDGVMIEVHYNPDDAISDGHQSIDYNKYREIRNCFQ